MKEEFIALEDLAIVRTERIRRWKISVNLENMGRADLFKDPTGISKVCFRRGGGKPKVRGVTDIDEPSHQQSAGETFFEDPRTGDREGSKKDFK